MNQNTQQKPEVTIHNLYGLKPVESTFNLSTEMLKNLIREIASTEIQGIRDVTFEFSKSDNSVRWFIWFDGNSDYFVDKSTNDTGLNASLRRLSKEFEKFALKYGWRESDDDPRGSNKVKFSNIIRPNKNPEVRDNLVYLQIAINPFLLAIFDMYGTDFKNMYGVNPPKTKMIRVWKFKKGHNGNENLLGLEVRKYVNSIFDNTATPRATMAGKFN